MSVQVASLASVALVSLVALVGLASLSLDEARVRRAAKFLVSFAVGALLGDTFLHLLPDVFADGTDPLAPSLLVLAGMLLFFVLEKLLRRREESLAAEPPAGRRSLPELASVNLVGDALHNCIDGVLIAASYLAGPRLGVATTLAVLLHEIPQELGDFGVLVHSGVPVRRALVLNLASASAAVAGCAATLVASTWTGAVLSSVLLPVTAGGFVYIAAANLIPELQRDRTLRGLFSQAALIALGVTAMALLTRIE
jgi:zinc and cadmium transporter